MAQQGWSFLLPLLLFGACCALAIWFLALFQGRGADPVHFAILAYFLVITAVLHHWQERGLSTDPKGFIRRFMAALVIKLVLSIALLIPILMRTPSDGFFTTGLLFAAFYLAFLVFSTLLLMTAVRKAPKP